MNKYKRVAIFYAPASGSPLARFGARWLGWDVEKAVQSEHPDISGLPATIDELTATPRKYGFHGTLKAPFRLAEGKVLDDLREAMKVFAGNQPIFSIGRMKVSNLGQFIAIVPTSEAPNLRDFAENVVRSFENFRAPLTEDDIAKRRKSNLTAHQDALMLKWGYPYIFDQFRFHLTLTGKLSDEHVAPVRDVLETQLSDILSTAIDVTDLCLYGERQDGRFEIIDRFPLVD